MPKLVRLYLSSIASGFAASLAFVALLLCLDVAGLRHLVLETAAGWIGGLMLLVFNGIVFSGVQFGIAVIRLAEDGEGRNRPPGGTRAPVLVPVEAKGRRARSDRGRRSVPESQRSQVGTR